VSVLSTIWVLYRRDLAGHAGLRRLRVPWREMFGFGLPVFSIDMAFVLRGLLVIVLLEFFHSASEVAEFQAVMPFARLNLVVIMSFSFLFAPAAARHCSSLSCAISKSRSSTNTSAMPCR